MTAIASETPALKSNPNPPAIIESHETCVCVRCQGAIPRETIQRHLSPLTGPPTRMVIFAKCEHCDMWYELKREARGSVWETVSALIVTNQHTIAGLNRKLDLLHGNRSVKAIG